MWMLEKRATVRPSTCAIVWRGEDRDFTIAVFDGVGGEDAALRILSDLKIHARKLGPEEWRR